MGVRVGWDGMKLDEPKRIGGFSFYVNELSLLIFMKVAKFGIVMD